MIEKSFTLEEIKEVAKWIVEYSQTKNILFYGEMGAGKTTLIKEILRHLKIKEAVSSPTFSIVNDYITPTGDKIFHFDFYRLESEEEAYDIGIEDYFDQNAWCFIEWPKRIENLLPLDALKITIKQKTNNERIIQLEHE